MDSKTGYKNGDSLYREQVQALPGAQPGPVVRDLKARGHFAWVDADLNELPTYLEGGHIWVPRHKDWESNPAGTPHVVWIRGLAYRVRWTPTELPAGMGATGATGPDYVPPPAPGPGGGVVAPPPAPTYGGGGAPVPATRDSLPLLPMGQGMTQQQDPLSMLLLLRMMGGGEEPRRKKKKKVKYVVVPSSAPAGYQGNGTYTPGAAPQGKK